MRDLEIEFLEEYKRIDAICGDMYSVKNGVSEYLSQMEQVPVQEQYAIVSWTDDYKMLKHLRWLRNQIVHDPAESMCEDSDLDALKEFHSRLLKAQDPLAVLNHLQKVRPSSAPIFNYKEDAADIHSSLQQPNGLLWVGIVVLAIVIACIYFGCIGVAAR